MSLQNYNNADIRRQTEDLILSLSDGEEVPAGTILRDQYNLTDQLKQNISRRLAGELQCAVLISDTPDLSDLKNIFDDWKEAHETQTPIFIMPFSGATPGMMILFV